MKGTGQSTNVTHELLPQLHQWLGCGCASHGVGLLGRRNLVIILEARVKPASTAPTNDIIQKETTQ